MNKLSDKIGIGHARGRGRGFYVSDEGCSAVDLGNSKLVLPGNWQPHTKWHHNDILYSWATIIQRALRGVQDGSDYKINGAYIEFDNTGSEVDPVPTVGRDEGLSYFNALTAPRDFLRVGIVATNEFNSDDTLFELPNGATYVIQTSGTVGFKNGLTFSDAAGSTVYGCSLVCIRDSGDQSKDLIFNRLYLDPTEQLPKLLGKQVSIIVQTQFE